MSQCRGVCCKEPNVVFLITGGNVHCGSELDAGGFRLRVPVEVDGRPFCGNHRLPAVQCSRLLLHEQEYKRPEDLDVMPERALMSLGFTAKAFIHVVRSCYCPCNDQFPGKDQSPGNGIIATRKHLLRC